MFRIKSVEELCQHFIEEASVEARKVFDHAALGRIPVREAIYKGYGKVLTKINVKSGFKNSGLWP